MYTLDVGTFFDNFIMNNYSLIPFALVCHSTSTWLDADVTIPSQVSFKQ